MQHKTPSRPPSKHQMKDRARVRAGSLVLDWIGGLSWKDTQLVGVEVDQMLRQVSRKLFERRRGSA